MEKELNPQTEWELMTFDALAEIAADDDVVVKSKDDLIAYLDSRSDDLDYKDLGNDRFYVLFA